MDIYVAGSRREVGRVRRMIEFAKSYGHSITFDWTGKEGEIRNDWSSNPDGARALAAREFNAVIDADVVIWLYSPHGIGARFEAAWAMLSGTGELWVVGYPKGSDSVFFYGEHTYMLDSDDEARARVTRLA